MLALAAFLILAPAARTLGQSDAAEARIVEIRVAEMSYQPAAVEARVGDRLRWIQDDSFAHTATSTNPFPGEPGGFDVLLIARGDTASVTLTRAGRIEYVCRPHPFMKGTIEVTP